MYSSDFGSCWHNPFCSWYNPFWQSFQPYEIFEGDVCKYREYWACERMRMSGGLLCGRSRHQGDLWTAKKQRIKSNLTFQPGKPSDQEPHKGMIKWSSTLAAYQKTSLRLQTLQQMTIKWLSLAVADWINGKYRRLVQLARGGWLFYTGERVNPAKSRCHPQKAGDSEGLLNERVV